LPWPTVVEVGPWYTRSEASIREGGFPKYVWTWLGEELYEARHVNGPQGTYKGYRLPDLTIARDGSDVILQWDADPVAGATGRLRFVGRGSERVNAAVFESSIQAVVDAVLARLTERLENNEARWSDHDLEELAIEFSVSPQLIYHQVENHGLGYFGH
jgi:hypothetical protein